MCFSATGFTVCPFGTATVRALIHLLLLCIVCVFLCYWLHCLSIRNGTVRALIRLLLLCIVCVFLCHWLHCLCSLFSIRNSHNHSIDSSAAVVHCVCVTLPLAPLCLSIRNSHNHALIHLLLLCTVCCCFSLPLAIGLSHVGRVCMGSLMCAVFLVCAVCMKA